jgi:hypothetical protein
MKQTFRRIAFKRRRIWVEAMQPTTIGARNLLPVIHFRKYARMILRRGLTDALEFLGADANFGYAAIIAEFVVDMAIVGRAHDPEDLNGRHCDIWAVRCPRG